MYLQQIEPGMQDLEYAAKEKVTVDHDVIDDAIREHADVSDNTRKASSRGELTTRKGIYGVLNSRGSPLPAQPGQGQEPQNQGLSGQGTPCGSSNRPNP